MKLFTRYNRISLPIIMGIFLLSGLSSYLWIDHLLIADFDDSLHEQAEKIASYAHKNGVFPKAGLTDDWVITYRQSGGMRLPHYETIQRYDPDDKDSTNYRNLTYSYQQDGHYYLVTISRSLDALEGLSRSIFMITTVTVLLVIIISLLLSHFVLKKLWRPFYDTLSLLKNFKLGRQQQIIFKNTAIDEFQFMNTQLHSMVSNAEKDYLLLKEFTENASHEMQTPISILRSKLDVIVQGENLSEQQTRAMEAAYLSLRRMTNLGQSLLLLSKIENDQFQENRLIDLEDKLKDKITQLSDFWLEKQLVVNLRCMPATITANPDLLDILLNNILSNASRHNVAGGVIDIYLKQGELIVCNTGGKEPIDPTRIYSRFYKQRQHSMNNGLGLAIIKQICDRSKIGVSYEYAEDLHKFSFTWPLDC